MPESPPGCTHRFGNIAYDARSGELWRDGSKSARLSPHLATLLGVLIEHPGELVTRETLRERLWPAGTFVDYEHGLTVAVGKLREALDDSPEEPVFIETIPRRGYRWLATVEPIPAAVASQPRQPSRFRPRTTAAVSLLGLAAALVWAWSRPAEHRNPGTLPTDLASRRAAEAERWGRYRFSTMNEAVWRQSLESYSRAIKEDPGLAAAYAGLAYAYAAGARFGFIPPRDGLARADALAHEALRLDERSADAHAALGDVRLLRDWDWPGAESAYRRALELEPDSARTLMQFAWFLLWAGRTDEAVRLAARASEFDPVGSMSPASVYAIARRYGDVLAWLERQEARGLLHPSPRATILRGLAFAGTRRCADAVRETDRALALLDVADDEVTLAVSGWLYATCGKPERAREILRRYEAPERRAEPDPISLAVVYGALGDTTHAIALIQRGVDDRSPTAVTLDADPMFDPLRKDPEFERLAALVRRSRSRQHPDAVK